MSTLVQLECLFLEHLAYPREIEPLVSLLSALRVYDSTLVKQERLSLQYLTAGILLSVHRVLSVKSIPPFSRSTSYKYEGAVLYCCCAPVGMCKRYRFLTAFRSVSAYSLAPANSCTVGDQKVPFGSPGKTYASQPLDALLVQLGRTFFVDFSRCRGGTFRRLGPLIFSSASTSARNDGLRPSRGEALGVARLGRALGRGRHHRRWGG